jgi:hypothetical protein
MALIPQREISLNLIILQILQNVPFMNQKVIKLVLLLFYIIAAPRRLLNLNFLHGSRVVDMLLPNIGDQPTALQVCGSAAPTHLIVVRVISEHIHAFLHIAGHFLFLLLWLFLELSLQFFVDLCNDTGAQDRAKEVDV